MGDQFASIKKLKTELGKWFLSARIFQIHANFKKISDHEIKFLNKCRSVGSRPFFQTEFVSIFNIQELLAKYRLDKISATIS